MKKVLKYILAFVLMLLLIGFLVTTFFPESLIPFMLNQQLKSNQSQMDKMNLFLEDKDRMYVWTVGTSSPLPNDRAQTGTAVIVNGHFFMFDVGDGVVKKAGNFGLPLDRLDAI